MNVRDFAKEREKIARRFTDRSKRDAAMRHLVREAGASVIIMAGKVAGWRMRDGKIVCVKFRHRDLERAELEITRMHATNWNGHRVPTRAYACPYCHGWHLTSQASMFEQSERASA